MSYHCQARLYSLLVLVGLSTVVTATPIVTPGFFPADEDVAGIRFRSFANTGGQELYMGIPDLGATPRAGRDLNWISGTNSIAVSYDSTTNVFSTTVTNATAGSPYTLNYGDFATDLVAKGKTLSMSDAIQMQITVADRDSSASVALNNVILNGNLLGSFGGAGFNDWTVTNFDFTQDFTLTADIDLSGTFSTSQELSRVELKLGAVPEPATGFSLLLGLVAMVRGMHRRFR